MQNKPWGIAHLLLTPQAFRWDIALDFLVSLPESKESDEDKSYNSILVIVDMSSKMVQYIRVCDTIDASQLVSILVHKLVLCGAGVPPSIVSYQGPQFTSKSLLALCYHLNIKQQLSTSYHPQTDWHMERWNQTLEQYLRAYVNYHQSDWSR